MIDITRLEKLSDVLWEIPKTFRSDMKVPARIFASEKMLINIAEDRSLEQLINVSTLPGIQKAALAMPDIHEGYGFPIGGVAAMDYSDGVISPGGIGYDINCGVRLLKSSLSFADIVKSLERIGQMLFATIPSGVGRGGRIKLNRKAMDALLSEGVSWAVREGYAQSNDQTFIESQGSMDFADPDAVSQQAKERGFDQLGTMGAGNHFVEVDRIDKIFDAKIAKVFGLFHNQIVIQIHTGSRGLGHQVATDYIRMMMLAMPKYAIRLPDRELACVPFASHEGMSYFNAMAAAANFAWTNRQIITFEIRQVFTKLFGKDNGFLSILYDVAHNIAKVETHTVNNKQKKLIVHRKGATRAFGPGNTEIPSVYRSVGQPVLIPGSMGTSSYVLAGTRRGREESFSSTCHGAGRTMSRHAARKMIEGRALYEKLKKDGILVETESMQDLPEESPFAYKDIEEVINVVHSAGIAKKVARLSPLVVVKG
jgi:tRNA-splicing ligase RtcB